MSHDKIMAGGSLEEVMDRLNGLDAILRMLHASVAHSGTLKGALFGACDLLTTICRDFQADIDGAEDCVKEGQQHGQG